MVIICFCLIFYTLTTTKEVCPMKSVHRISLVFLLLLVLLMGCAAASAEDVLTLPSSLKVIQEEAFNGDTSISKVILPEGIKRIESKAFADSSLTEINLPDSLEYIADDAFGLPLKVSFTMNEDSYAYQWATEHYYFYVSTSAEDFSYETIEGDEAHCVITGYNGTETELVLPAYSPDGRIVSKIGESAFESSDISGVTIPNSVTSIGDDAFAYCCNLTSISIPEGVTSIGNKAFYGCYSLTSITIPDSVTSIGEGAFNSCYGLADADGFIIVGNILFQYDGESDIVSIPNGVTSISVDAFVYCTSLTSITIPDSVTSIGDGAFRECSNLTDITIPKNVTSIGDGAFESCSSLTSITIPDSVTSIGVCAFFGCSNLTSITIPDSVTSIGEKAIGYCSSELIIYGAPNSAAEKYAYENEIQFALMEIYNYDYEVIDDTHCAITGYNGSKTELVLPAYSPDGHIVSKIGESAFESSDITGVTIPDSVTSIGNNAFESSNLTSITIPDSVTSIGNDAFAYCCNLTSIREY